MAKAKLDRFYSPHYEEVFGYELEVGDVLSHDNKLYVVLKERAADDSKLVLCLESLEVTYIADHTAARRVPLELVVVPKVKAVQ